MSISGGEFGFDEGGVLQALFSRPFLSKEVTYYEYTRSGKVRSQHTDRYEITMGDIVIPLILTGAVSISIFSIKAIVDGLGDLSQDKKEKLLFGYLPDLLRKGWEYSPFGLYDAFKGR